MSAEWIEALKKENAELKAENTELKKELEEYKHILDSNLANIHPDSVVITEKEYMRLLSVESGLRAERDRYKEALEEVAEQVPSDNCRSESQFSEEIRDMAKQALGDE